MTLFLVNQLRFTRAKWLSGLRDVSPEDAVCRFEPGNSISWIIGHLANQERTYYLERAQGKVLLPELKQFGSGQPASTPPLDEVWSLWQAATKAADEYLDTLTPESVLDYWVVDGKPQPDTIGTNIMRMIYHYWFHLGEAMSIRERLGHTNVPQFVASMENGAYQPD
jgi:uncharacterized damage-inducible protein DinB